jgi:hypothetical protein
MKKLHPLLSVLFLIYWGCESDYILGSKRQNITEKNKKDMVDKFSNYLLKK